MDLDLDFSNDKIEAFLLAKLEEIRVNNEALEIVLNQHKQSVKYPDDTFSNCLEVKETWKRIFNNRYSITYEILHPSKNFESLKVFLSWNSEESFCYNVQIFGNLPEIKESCDNSKNCDIVTGNIRRHPSGLIDKSYVVIVFDIPQFLDKIKYEIAGNIIFNSDGQDSYVAVPIVHISPKDFTTDSTYLIYENSVCNIFTFMSCLNQTDLVMILPDEWTVSVITTFEIHCALRYIDISVSCKLYFVAYEISKLFNNTLITVHPHRKNKNTIFLNMYTNSNKQFYALCHHLGTCLPNVILLPASYYEFYLSKNASYSKELLEEFKNSMSQEMDLSCKFAQTFSNGNNPQTFDQFRTKLSIIESKTDELFLKVSNMKY